VKSNSQTPDEVPGRHEPVASWVGFLAAAGFEAVYWSDVGPGDAPDAELMGWAADHGHVILTSDLGFAAILAATRSRRPSVVQIRGELLIPAAVGATVLAAVGQAAAELQEGALLSVDALRGRLRILPLRD
jgi:predicted nuclease of predicted toxin-antitoxin system